MLPGGVMGVFPSGPVLLGQKVDVLNEKFEQIAKQRAGTSGSKHKEG